MSGQSLTERIAARQVSLGLVVAILIVICCVALTLVFQFWLRWIDLSQNLTDIWIWIVAVMLGIAANLFTRGITLTKKDINQTISQQTITSQSPRETSKSLLLTPRQYKYREEVRADLLRIRIQLHDFIVPKLILFKSWNESTEPDFHNLKHQLIGIKEQDEAIERFSTALNNRNDNRLSSKFHELAEECIAQFREISKTGFLDESISQDRLQPPNLVTERTKPQAKAQLYNISLAQEPEIIRMREIRVQVGTGKPRSEEAWFYVVSIGVPSGAESVFEVQPMFNLPTTHDIYAFPFITTTGKPWIHVSWPLPPEASDFDEQRDFAKALVADKSLWIEKLNLEEGHALIPFIFLFTVRGGDSIYFPAPHLIAMKMPTKFRTALFLQAKGRPRVVAKVFEVNARTWDSVSVNEVRDSPLP